MNGSGLSALLQQPRLWGLSARARSKKALIRCRQLPVFGVEGATKLIQPHMAQEPVLRGEVGCACVAREVSAERGGMGERGCARRLGGCGFEAD